MTDVHDTVEPEAQDESATGNGTGGTDSTHGRRKFIIGGAAGAAALAAGVYGLARGGGTPTPTDRVVAKKIGGEVPVDDPGSSLWGKAKAAHIELDSQIMFPPNRPTPFQPTVKVKALHDGSTIGFLVEWKDPEQDDLTIKCDAFRDACAVLLAPYSKNASVRIMGTAEIPATLLHWKADWQRDVDHGFQDLEVAFPNSTFDYHPPIPPTEEMVEKPLVTVPDDYEAAKATMWLPAYHVGNPIANAKKTTSVEKLIAKGFGTATTLGTQDALGKGEWKDGKWKVVLAKPMAASDDGETAIEAGKDYSMAVAVWAGKELDAGGHKSPSKLLLTLNVEA